MNMKTTTEETEQEASFDDLDLSPVMRQGSQKSRIRDAFAHSARPDPLALDGHDVIGQAARAPEKQPLSGFPFSSNSTRWTNAVIRKRSSSSPHENWRIKWAGKSSDSLGVSIRKSPCWPVGKTSLANYVSLKMASKSWWAPRGDCMTTCNENHFAPAAFGAWCSMKRIACWTLGFALRSNAS